jgi:hypothetical protein
MCDRTYCQHNFDLSQFDCKKCFGRRGFFDISRLGSPLRGHFRYHLAGRSDLTMSKNTQKPASLGFLDSYERKAQFERDGPQVNRSIQGLGRTVNHQLIYSRSLNGHPFLKRSMSSLSPSALAIREISSSADFRKASSTSYLPSQSYSL